MNSLNRNRLQGSNNNIVVVVMAIFSLSVIGTIAAFSPFDHIQVAAAQQEKNNNTKLFSLSTISTTIGTGAAATGAIVTVPGYLKGRKQSKLLGTYLLKIHINMTNFVKQQNLQTKTKMNIWTSWMLCVVILYACCKRET